MKKIVLILFSVFLLTGCTVVRIDTKSIDNTLHVVLSKNNQLYNRVGKGYKYYIPRGVSYIDTDEFNDKLYSNGNYYYLYIDAISYYYQKKVDYVENPDVYYSRKISINDKEGYLTITEIDGQYLVDFVYNYARIQAKVVKSEINDVVLNASYILSTIKFNSNVIKLMLNEDYFLLKEEKYDEFTPKVETNNYIRYEDDPKEEESESGEIEDRGE